MGPIRALSSVASTQDTIDCAIGVPVPPNAALRHVAALRISILVQCTTASAILHAVAEAGWQQG